MISKLNNNYYMEDIINHPEDKVDTNKIIHTDHHLTPILVVDANRETLHLSSYFADDYSKDMPMITVKMVDGEKLDIRTYNALFIDPRKADYLEIVALGSYFLVTNRNKHNLSITNSPISFEDAYHKNNYVEEIRHYRDTALNISETIHDSDYKNEVYKNYDELLKNLEEFPKEKSSDTWVN